MRKLLKPWVLACFVAAVALLAFYLRPHPDCNCYYPNSERYGVLSGSNGCVETQCVPPKSKPKPATR